MRLHCASAEEATQALYVFIFTLNFTVDTIHFNEQ